MNKMTERVACYAAEKINKNQLDDGKRYDCKCKQFADKRCNAVILWSND